MGIGGGVVKLSNPQRRRRPTALHIGRAGNAIVDNRELPRLWAR
jgi:hypothetical protein